MCFKSNMLFIRLGYYSYTGFYLKWLKPIVNPGVGCQWQQRGKMPVAQPKWCQFSVEDGGFFFLAIRVTFVGSQFLTDFDYQNRCLCSRRSHGPLLREFCLCFHFNHAVVRILYGFCTLKWTRLAVSDVTGVLAGFSADLDDGHIPAWRTTNCVLYISITCPAWVAVTIGIFTLVTS